MVGAMDVNGDTYHLKITGYPYVQRIKEKNRCKSGKEEPKGILIELPFFSKTIFHHHFFQNEKHNERREISLRFPQKMTESQTQRTLENVLEKKGLAIRLMFGKEVEKDEVKAVRLLKECAEDGDAEAMLMLGECCALGRGVKHNSERAQVLLTYAAECGNRQAHHMMKLINEWKGERIDLFGLLMISPSSSITS